MRTSEQAFWILFGVACALAGAYIGWAAASSWWAGGYVEFLPARG